MTRRQKMMIHVNMWMRRLFTRENMSIASRCVKELLSNVLVALCVGKSILEKTGIWFGAAAASLASQLMSNSLVFVDFIKIVCFFKKCILTTNHS